MKIPIKKPIKKMKIIPIKKAPRKMKAPIKKARKKLVKISNNSSLSNLTIYILFLVNLLVGVGLLIVGSFGSFGFWRDHKIFGISTQLIYLIVSLSYLIGNALIALILVMSDKIGMLQIKTLLGKILT